MAPSQLQNGTPFTPAPPSACLSDSSTCSVDTAYEMARHVLRTSRVFARFSQDSVQRLSQQRVGLVQRFSFSSCFSISYRGVQRFSFSSVFQYQLQRSIEVQFQFVFQYQLQRLSQQRVCLVQRFSFSSCFSTSYRGLVTCAVRVVLVSIEVLVQVVQRFSFCLYGGLDLVCVEVWLRARCVSLSLAAGHCLWQVLAAALRSSSSYCRGLVQFREYRESLTPYREPLY